MFSLYQWDSNSGQWLAPAHRLPLKSAVSMARTILTPGHPVALVPDNAAPAPIIRRVSSLFPQYVRTVG